MSMTVVSYLLYLLIAVPLTLWVARTLSHNGRLFLVEVFHGNEELAGAVNRLLVVGFYLVNLGFVTLSVRGHAVAGVQDMIERLSAKLGVVLLVLGLLHLVDVYVFNAIRRRSRLEELPPASPASTFPPTEPAVTHTGY
ncbi:MAG TPA: hypothetical protein VEK80_01945 [Kribbellaceae bacterium]|nr:hypothetical protein [Kribbellaceae bacterium]